MGEIAHFFLIKILIKIFFQFFPFFSRDFQFNAKF